MTLDEFEAIRLADLEGLYQQQAAKRMGVSRTTFGRILDQAHRKVAEILVHGRTLTIEGGPVSEVRPRTVHCPRCDHPWRATGRSTPPAGCPRCRLGAG
jgi:hypothetical protein